MFYKKCLLLLGPSSGQDNIHKIIGTKLYNYWYRFLTFKANYIGCIVYLFQGMHAEEQQKMGERVAYYQQAAEKLRDAIKIVNYFDLMQVKLEELIYMNDMLETKCKVAKNENELMYHEEVPHDALLYEEPICSVNVLAIDLTDPEVSGPIIFSRLVPSGPHGASALYSEEKAKLLRSIVSMAEEKNTQMTDFISSLKLGPLNLDSDQNLEETAERCAKMNAEVEIIDTLVESMNNLAMIIDDVEQSLAEIEKRIQDDTLKEEEYHRAMSPRPLSIVQMDLSRELHEFQEAYARTHESNQVLLKAMTLHISNLKMLSKPLDVSIENIKSTDNETTSQMRRMIGKLENMKAHRDWLIQQLREDITMDDIITRLLIMDPNDLLKQVLIDELEKHMPTVKLFIKNTMNQENIIEKLAPAYSTYGDLRIVFIRLLKKRETLINASINSYDEHRELLEKSQMAQEFYKKLQIDVNNLLARVWITCQVQQEERQQLLPGQKPKTFTHWIHCCWTGH
ncbi:hypothetical protein K1T71_002838 [Dendrolimus kikuchii]|uniref:Uncharacterized protein n=1 Tax=Dendrolimus kikuchii TaxID=765133 RepID=A0ACC1DET0_9NEOP|nr:hypothetical protein K1T71_002838 [Dendrolimus kikuchii]